MSVANNGIPLYFCTCVWNGYVYMREHIQAGFILLTYLFVYLFIYLLCYTSLIPLLLPISMFMYLKFYSYTWLSFGAEYFVFQFAIQAIKIKIYRTIILLVVLYGYETWSLTLREERRLRLFENRVFMRLFGPKREEATREWRKLHNAEVNDLYSSPNIFRVIKSRRMRWAEHAASIEDRRDLYRVLVGKLERKRTLRRPRHRQEDDIKTDSQVVRWEEHGLA